jgi:uncharacterized membrane protein
VFIGRRRRSVGVGGGVERVGELAAWLGAQEIYFPSPYKSIQPERKVSTMTSFLDLCHNYISKVDH